VLVVGDSALAIGSGGSMARDIASAIAASGSMVEDIASTTNAGGLVIEGVFCQIVLAVWSQENIAQTIISLVVGAIALIVGSSSPINESLTLITSVLSHQFWWFI